MITQRTIFYFAFKYFAIFVLINFYFTRAMYQLMAKWEELNKNMAPAYRISSQIKDIKRLLDMFEAALN